jgi:protein KRI1
MRSDATMAEGKKTMNPDLLGSDDEQEESNLVINKRYAKDFQIRKQHEDLRNNPVLSDDDDASTSSSEDEDGVLLTTKLDTDIMKTINALRSKDSKIYDPQVAFFASDGEEASDDEGGKKRKAKPKRYKDVIREQALAQIEEEEQAVNKGEQEGVDSGKSHRLAYDKEQEEIRKSFLKSTDGDSNDDSSDDEDSDDDDDDGLLVVKKKGDKEDEGNLQEFLGEVERLESTLGGEGHADLVDPKGEVDNGSKFLLNFFKHRAWIDKDDPADDSEEDEGEPERRAAGDDEKDEAIPMKTEEADGNESDASLNQLEKSDDFESQYNFRFEEASGNQSGAAFSLISYARGQTVNTLRRKDDSRRDKRLARNERKTAERRAKEEELKRLKNLKRFAMEQKLEEVKKVVGHMDDDDGDMDEAAIMKLIEGDYDPEEFEKKMQETFGDDFYEKEDPTWKTDHDVRDALMKDDDGNLIAGQGDDGDMYDDAENPDDEGAEYGGEDEAGDDGWANNEDYQEDDAEAYEEEEGTELERKLKSKMEDELYKLDYEDIVAGMPTRFKYRQVESNDYGLSTEEILFAQDATLKQFVSLKKMAPYREEGEYNANGRKRRRFRDTLKLEIEEELKASGKQEPAEPKNEEEPEEEEATSTKRKRRRSKKNKSDDKEEQSKEKAVAEEKVSREVEKTNEPAVDDDTANEAAKPEEPKQKKRRRQKKKKSSQSSPTEEQLPTLEPEMGAREPPLVEKEAESASAAVAQPNKKKKEERSTNLVGSPESKGETGEESTDNAGIEEVADKKGKKDKKTKAEKKAKKERQKDKKRQKKIASTVEGISTSRMSSYGL